MVLSATSFVLFLVVTALVATGGVQPLDTTVHQLTLTYRRPWATMAATYLTAVGSVPAVVATAVMAAVLLRWRTRQWVLPTVLLLSVGVTAAVVYLLKIAVGRARPASGSLLGTPSLDYSFPSGHTTDGSVVLVLTALLVGITIGHAATRRLVLLLGIVTAVGVGLTRVYLGYHWTSDVVGGWLLATSVVSLAGYAALAFAGPPVGGQVAGLTARNLRAAHPGGRAESSR